MARAVEVFRRNAIELERLLQERKETAKRLEQEVEERTRDLSEALEYQTAMSDVLNVISRSPTQLQPVLDVIVNTAARLCAAEYSYIAKYERNSLRYVAHVRVSDEHLRFLADPISIDRGAVIGRVALERQTVHVPDVLADSEFDRFEWQKVGKQRTVLGVPLLREGALVGVIILARTSVAPFTEKQIELVTTFADQAVIAIENARLFDEVQARTHELTEALEQQTATAEILRVISISPTDAQPVFETIVRNAVSLCDSLFANVFRFDGELLHFVASHNVGPDYVELLRTKYPMHPDSSQVSGRVLLTKSVVRLEDVLTDPDYDQRFPAAMGWRRMLGVPMLRKGNSIGVIVVGWAESGPIPAIQEELLKTFADQAVIAIENARLFDEIQDKTRQLEIADKYKSHFLASASHDLRQPLHALNLFVAQLRGESDPGERARLIERIDAATASMNELFGALLDMSKLEAGILEPNPAEFPVARLLERIETTFADAAREKGIRLCVVPSDVWIRSDFILLERILLNLVSNAVRYTERGGVLVGCRRRGERLRIDVCDSGPGIPREQQSDIFREYYQLGSVGSERRRGLGLGLAIVDRLGRLLDHEIELVSRPGRGSRFSVSVPRVAIGRGATEVPLSPAVADPASGKLVVVIDDDALVLDGMGGILRSWGCKVVAAGSEQAALSEISAERQRPDLIIADYRLANGMTGIQAIKRLREAVGAPVQAFLISGDTAPERLRHASENGFPLLHKPVAPMRLRAMVNQLLKTAVIESTAGE
jgi:two-component system, sensor histidine kinase